MRIVETENYEYGWNRSKNKEDTTMKMMYIAVEDVKNGDSFWGKQSEDLEQVRKDLENSYNHCTESEKAKRTFYIVGYEYPEDMDFNDWSEEQICLPDPKYYEEYHG